MSVFECSLNSLYIFYLYKPEKLIEAILSFLRMQSILYRIRAAIRNIDIVKVVQRNRL